MNVPVSILVAGGLIAFTIWTQEVNNRADQACYHLWRSIPSEIIAATALTRSEKAGQVIAAHEAVFGATLDKCRKR